MIALLVVGSTTITRLHFIKQLEFIRIWRGFTTLKARIATGHLEETSQSLETSPFSLIC